MEVFGFHPTIPPIPDYPQLNQRTSDALTLLNERHELVHRAIRNLQAKLQTRNLAIHRPTARFDGGFHGSSR
jgi:hypothetical protein